MKGETNVRIKKKLNPVSRETYVYVMLILLYFHLKGKKENKERQKEPKKEQSIISEKPNLLGY